MPTHLQQAEEEAAATYPGTRVTSIAGELLDAGLAADQAARARVEAKWVGRMRRFDAAQNRFSRGLEGWFKKLIITFAAGTAGVLVTTPFREPLGEFGNLLVYGVPILATALLIGWVGLNIIGNKVLDWIFPMLRALARQEGIELHGPSVKRPSPRGKGR